MTVQPTSGGSIVVGSCPVCGARLAHARVGRRPVYCSGACRKRAYRRRRHENFDGLLAATNTTDRSDALAAALRELPTDILGLPQDPDAAVETCVGLAVALVHGFGQCATRARPQYSWRCARASTEVAAILRRYFEP